MGVRGRQRSVINLVSRPACTGVVWSLSCLMSVFVTSVRYQWFPSERNPADEPSRRFECAHPCDFKLRIASTLFFSWMSAHRVLIATLCNESKRKRISVPSLDKRPLKLLKNSSGLPTAPSKPLLYRLDSPLTSAGDRRLRRQRRSQDSHSRARLGRPPGLNHGTAPLDAGVGGGGRKDAEHVLASSSPSPWVVDPTGNTPRLDRAYLGLYAGRVLWNGVTRQDMATRSELTAGPKAVS